MTTESRWHRPDSDYELFRRAIEDGDQAAWTEIHEIYRPFMLARARRCISGLSTSIADDLIQGAFYRFVKYYTRDKLALAKHAVGPIIVFMATCMVCEVNTYLERHIRDLKNIEDPEAGGGSDDDDDDPVMRLMDGILESGDDDSATDPTSAAVIRRQRLIAFWDCVKSTCRDAKDAFLVVKKLREGMKPAEIVKYCQLHPPPVFTTTQAIFERWSNFMDRFKRAPCLQMI